MGRMMNQAHRGTELKSFTTMPAIPLTPLFDPWHNEYMLTRSSKDHDFAVNVFRVGEHAIGERMDGTPLEDPNSGKNPAAVALGRLGGQKGGKARAAKLSPARRKAIAKKAAAARWRPPS